MKVLSGIEDRSSIALTVIPFLCVTDEDINRGVRRFFLVGGLMYVC